MYEWKMGMSFKMPCRSRNLADSTTVDLKLCNLFGSFFK